MTIDECNLYLSWNIKMVYILKLLKIRLQFYFKFTFIEQKDSVMNCRIDRRIAEFAQNVCFSIRRYVSDGAVAFARETASRRRGSLFRATLMRVAPDDSFIVGIDGTPTAPWRHPDGTPPTRTRAYSVSVAQALHPPPLLALLVPFRRRRGASRRVASSHLTKRREIARKREINDSRHARFLWSGAKRDLAIETANCDDLSLRLFPRGEKEKRYSVTIYLYISNKIFPLRQHRSNIVAFCFGYMYTWELIGINKNEDERKRYIWDWESLASKRR